MERPIENILEFAAEHPEVAAAEDSEGITTYGQLADQSASVTAALAGFGFREGDAAAVYVPYSRQIVSGMVPVVWAGGVCVPLEEQHPVQRLESILEDCGAKAILTIRALWEKKPLNAPGAKILFLDEQEDVAAPAKPPRQLPDDAPALLLYTSGTSGRPRGLLHSRGFLTHCSDGMSAVKGAEIDADTRNGVMASFSFVAAQVSIWGTLTKGGTACIVPEAARQDLASLYRYIGKNRITHVFLPSGLAAILAENYDIRNMRIFTGGEKLRAYRALVPGNCLINCYGSTETSVVMAQRIYGNEPTITVGKPYSGARACIMDEALQPLPTGEAGELLMTSDVMARRYYREAELSAEKWITIDGTLWYRTGDRARCLEDGTYEILGRMDHMIKLRGFRIDTGEVEAQISQTITQTGQSGVGAAVVVKKTVHGSENLCCYYEAEQALDRKAVTREIAKSLPAYMLPNFWIRMDALPRNTNGKVMREQLPQPEMERKAVCDIEDEVVARVAMAAANALGIEGAVSPEDSFIALGGTSLTAVLMAQWLEDRGVRVSVAQILRLDVIERIAEAAETIWEGSWTPAEFDAVQADFEERGEHIQKILPLSARQDRMVYERAVHPDQNRGMEEVLLQLDSSISQAHLREALDALSEEYEELRSSVIIQHVSAVRQVITDRKIPLEMAEMETLDREEMIRIHNQMMEAPFDLQRSSLMRVYGLHGGRETFLYVATHKTAVGKAWRRVLLTRLMALLRIRYPQDASIRDWQELLEMDPPSADEVPQASTASSAQAGEQRSPASVPGKLPPEIYVYSGNEGPKLVFVHTGNTGSEAYYRLAEQIRGEVSFAVIEPYNLYHPEDVRHGIRAIAANYIEILKRYQPNGPYLLGGWCYGGVVAHEMACQLEEVGEQVRHLFLLDAHALDRQELVTLAKSMRGDLNRGYFETSPLFAELRQKGMLEAVLRNAGQVSQDMREHRPSMYMGPVTYFKPCQIPAGVSAEGRKYWETMMRFSAGNYEHYFQKEKARIVLTPDEHDLMMEQSSLDIIVPEIRKALQL
ncbi:MAG: AMP-binding protein [Clostridia bacterium]|nr:AMP-binding protein [Clostridia bacterium]